MEIIYDITYECGLRFLENLLYLEFLNTSTSQPADMRYGRKKVSRKGGCEAL